MKTTGMSRTIDNLGRIVIPKKLRTTLEWEVGDDIEIFTSGDKVVLRKRCKSDIFTGETEDLIEYEGKTVARSTIRTLAKLAGFEITKEYNEFDIENDIDSL